MSQRDVAPALVADLRVALEAALADDAFDAEEALAKLRRLEQTIHLLCSVSLNSFGEFERGIRELSLLSRIGEIFVSVFDLDRMSRALLQVVSEALPSENAFLYLSDPACQLELRAVIGPKPTAGDLDIAEAVGALVTTGSEPTCVSDVGVDRRFRGFGRPENIRSLLACPLEAVGESLGAIVLSESRCDAFSPDRARILRPIADLAALAVRHARVCAQNMEHRRDLEALVERRTREVNEARAALSRQERTAAMGKLAASIAHEVNNPMSFLVSNIERAVDYAHDIESSLPLLLEILESVLRLPASSDERVRSVKALADRARAARAIEQLSVVAGDFGELLAETREGADRIQRVGENLRGFAQGITGVMEPVDINRLVETALHIVKAEAKDRIRFERRLGVLPDVRCQNYQITQVLLNLLQNGVEAIAGDGEVRVTTRALDRWVEVEVVDDGSGIPPDQTDRIFEPFLTTKLSGSGLGLSISRDIVRAHCGSLDFRSSPEGSVFTLRLAVGGPDRALQKPD
ncbi:MAG: sensor histidine kinase [Myxococcota bacterium]